MSETLKWIALAVVGASLIVMMIWAACANTPPDFDPRDWEK